MLSGRRSAGSVCPGSGWQPMGVGPSACGPGADSACIVALAPPDTGSPPGDFETVSAAILEADGMNFPQPSPGLLRISARDFYIE